MFRIAGDAIQGMSPTDRAAYGRAAFGARGMGAVAVLGDPAVAERMHQLDNIRQSRAFLDRYQSYGHDSLNGTTMQDARVALAQFNVTTGELARTTLPALNIVLGNFRSILDGIRSVLPGGTGKDGALIGARAMEFAGAGALAGGVAFGPAGAVLGAVGGGVVGGVEGIAEQFMAQHHARDLNEVRARREAVVPPISFSLNIDGTTLGRVLSNVATYSFDGQAPSFDGTGAFQSPTHQDTSN